MSSLIPSLVCKSPDQLPAPSLNFTYMVLSPSPDNTQDFTAAKASGVVHEVPPLSLNFISEQPLPGRPTLWEAGEDVKMLA